MTSPFVEFTYELTPELSRAATRRVFQHLLGWRVPLLLLAYAGACAVQLMIGPAFLTGIFIGMGVLLVALVVAAYSIRMRRNAALLAMLADRAARCRITDEGMELHYALGSSVFAWSMVKKVVRYPDVWLLYVGPQPFWLPADRLADGAGELILERVPRRA